MSIVVPPYSSVSLRPWTLHELCFVYGNWCKFRRLVNVSLRSFTYIFHKLRFSLAVPTLEPGVDLIPKHRRHWPTSQSVASRTLPREQWIRSTKFCWWKRSPLFTPRTTMPGDNNNAAKLHCLCHGPSSERFMISCDGGCDTWFHGKWYLRWHQSTYAN